MNILLIAVAIAAVCKMIDGYKKGMVKEIISLVSLIVLCFVAALIANGVNSYTDGQVINVIASVFLLCLLGIAHHLLGVVFFSAKVISRLPVIHFLNKLLGIVFGAFEVILFLWTVYTFIMLMDIGIVGSIISEYTADSEILTWIYQHNYLAYLIQKHLGDLSFISL